MIEPISVRLVSMIWDFIQHPRTAVSCETAIANSQQDFLHNVICDFFAELLLDRKIASDSLDNFETLPLYKL